MVSIALPVKDPLLSVAGTSGDDVWMVTSGNNVLRWDGRSVRIAARGACAYKGDPQNTVAAYCAPRFGAIAVTRDEILLGGRICDDNGSLTPYLAKLTRGGKVTCDCRPRPPGGVQSGLLARGSSMLHFGYGYLTGLDGTPLPVPLDNDLPLLQSIAAFPSLLGLWGASDRSLARFNGLAWVQGPDAPFPVASLWVDDQSTAWAISAGGRSLAQLKGSEWTVLPVPPGFEASHMEGSSSTDVWFFGPDQVTQWDGQRYRRAQSLVRDVESTWRDPAGAIWVVGGSVPRDDGLMIPPESKGVAIRVPSTAEQAR
ncbi:MAG: hypothetical protein HY898_24060 [Deltaproteobacteria bacterium]|nr:hypothetical protein [Deltaproteobacteria bacterium]